MTAAEFLTGHPQFDGYDPALVQIVIDRVECTLCEDAFGCTLEEATGALVAHLLLTLYPNQDSTGNAGGVQAGAEIESYRLGDYSVTYNVRGGDNGKASAYSATAFGRRFELLNRRAALAACRVL